MTTSLLRGGWLVVFLFAGCAGAGNSAMTGPAPQTAASPAACDVTVFPGVAPYEVADLGPVQAICPGSGAAWSTRGWTSCGIDQPNLLEVACSSGADTVFGLYETVGENGRIMHGHLGKRGHPATASAGS